jgi:hypothetical protein
MGSRLPDIFLSYSSEDLAIARRFAEGFVREGFSVWWDATLNPGDAFDQAIEKALEGKRPANSPSGSGAEGIRIVST